MSWELECECTNTHILESPHHLLPSGNGLCSGQAWAWILTWHLKSVVLLQKQWLLWLKLDNLSALHGHPLQSIPPHHFTPKMLDTDDHEAISPCFLLFLTHLLFINAFLKDSLLFWLMFHIEHAQLSFMWCCGSPRLFLLFLISTCRD